MPRRWNNGIVIGIEDMSSTTKRFFVECEEVIPFKAGQFVIMDLPVSEKRLNRWKSYSIANPPTNSNVFEFAIVNLEGGLASDYLFNTIKVGDSLKFKDPDGGFVLPEKIDHDVIMLCTGTGVAPFKSMLYDVFENEKSDRKFHLIFGTRYEEGILYRDEFEALEKKWPNFKYTIALSREKNWDGHKGYIHPIYSKLYKNTTIDRHFYICGWTQMVDEAVANLVTKMAYPLKQIHYELYG